MRAEILSIGTELLIGDILNTNARWLSRRLAENAIDVTHQTTVGDNVRRIARALEAACLRADLVLCTGGLGPTEDDATLRGLSFFLERPLVFHAPTLRHIRRRLKARGFATVSKLIQKQCYVPRGAKKVFNNHFGTAPGVLCELPWAGNHKWLLVLPGPPNEMRPMFRTQALPDLLRLPGFSKSSFLIRTLKIAGLPESRVAQRVNDLLSLEPPVTVGIYAKLSEVQLKIMAKHRSRAQASRLVDKIQRTVERRLGSFIFGRDDDTLASVVGKSLLSRKQTIAVAESCTAGTLGQFLTEPSGSSRYFIGGVLAYADRVKTAQLGVPKEILRRHGAVSRQTALELASRVREKFGTSYGVSLTGIAGPTGGSKIKPVGLVYIGIADGRKTAVHKKFFFGTRAEIRTRAALEALDLLRRSLSRRGSR